jgi:hypothetical protein
LTEPPVALPLPLLAPHRRAEDSQAAQLELAPPFLKGAAAAAAVEKAPPRLVPKLAPEAEAVVRE